MYGDQDPATLTIKGADNLPSQMQLILSSSKNQYLTPVPGTSTSQRSHLTLQKSVNGTHIPRQIIEVMVYAVEVTHDLPTCLFNTFLRPSALGPDSHLLESRKVIEVIVSAAEVTCDLPTCPLNTSSNYQPLSPPQSYEFPAWKTFPETIGKGSRTI